MDTKTLRKESCFTGAGCVYNLLLSVVVVFEIANL